MIPTSFLAHGTAIRRSEREKARKLVRIRETWSLFKQEVTPMESPGPSPPSRLAVTSRCSRQLVKPV